MYILKFFGSVLSYGLSIAILVVIWTYNDNVLIAVMDFNLAIIKFIGSYIPKLESALRFLGGEKIFLLGEVGLALKAVSLFFRSIFEKSA